jgi:hypothetical protein
VVRESANRAKCQNNLRQLVIAVHHFHENNGTVPTYHGIYPPMNNGVEPWRNRSRLYGSWFAHLLPYLEENNLHQEITEEVVAAQFNERRSNVVTPGTPPSGAGTGTQTIVLNGKTYTYTYTTWTDPGTATQYSYDNHGVWIDQAKGKKFPTLICPSDPSPTSDRRAAVGWVYIDQSPPWGSTNYLANWHAFGDEQRGFWTVPQGLHTIVDGLSNTVLFGEGYAWCDDRGRLALYAANYHNFGLTWAMSNVQYPIGSPPTSYPSGLANTFLFQVRPLPRAYSRCPAGHECCDGWRAQTPHSAMNVALADGSVRTVSGGISQSTWDNALQPRDGNVLGSDW